MDRSLVREPNTDVTEQRETELRAAEAERRLQAALQSGRIGTWSWDFESDLVEADEKLRDLFCLDAEGDVPVRNSSAASTRTTCLASMRE
jgi:PAS domain-containing protein